MDWIQGDKFRGLADFSYSPYNKLPDDYDNLDNTFNPAELKPCNLVYTHTMYVGMLLNIIKHLGKKFIIMTHSCDISIEKYGTRRLDGKGTLSCTEEFTIPDNVIKWYGKNVNAIDPRIESIPIGLENDWWCKKIKKKKKMLEKLQEPRKIKNLVYMNHKIGTNPDKREMLYSMFESKPWVTADRDSNGHRFSLYIDNVYNHKFVLSPEGNGMDTHRTWECLYMGTIPIEKRNINNQFYADFPICFVDDWKQVTKTFLEREYTRIKKISWDREKLGFEYWKNKIRTHTDFVNFMNSGPKVHSGYATHQMVLLDTLKRVNKPVLELGSGEYSTVQIHNALKNTFIKILTIEADKKWLEKYLHLKTDLHDLQQMVDSEIPKFYAKDKEEWGLVFIDNLTWEARSTAITKYKDVADYIVLHDCDALPLYDKAFGDIITPINPEEHDPGIRDYSKTFKYWIEFFVEDWKQWHPPVLLASNKVCLDNIQGIDGMIISNRNKKS